MKFKTLNDFNETGKKVLARTDFNVPLDDNGNITDAKRIEASLPTIRFLLEKGCKVIIMSHLGRPKGDADDKLKMDKVAQKLSELLGAEVKKLDNCIDVEMP
ncbi:phosphoglycerate kinase, partial [Candidatus Woesearchaeota archaeon]|nr:phosphoglycerate kinase [Candidatus Woesearchaeota archaeon]